MRIQSHAGVIMLLLNKFINKSIIYGVVCITVFLIWWGILYINNIGYRKDQKKIFSKLTHLTAKELSSVELQFVKRYKLIEQEYFIVNSDLHEFLSFFNNADFMQAGGHNTTIYDCIIVFKNKNGDEDKFVGTAFSEYEFNKDALYIYKYYFEQKNGYYLAKETGLPIRVPKLGAWIMERYPAASQ